MCRDGKSVLPFRESHSRLASSGVISPSLKDFYYQNQQINDPPMSSSARMSIRITTSICLSSFLALSIDI